MGKRTQHLIGGFALSFLWVCAPVVTIASNHPPTVEHWRWVVTHGPAALAGADFGAAAVTKSPTAP